MHNNAFIRACTSLQRNNLSTALSPDERTTTLFDPKNKKEFIRFEVEFFARYLRTSVLVKIK